MTAPNATETPAPSAGQGVKPSDGDSSGGTPRTFTKDEVEELIERRIRGKAAEADRAQKALAKFEADAKAREDAVLAEQGKHKELAERLTADAKARDEREKAKDEKIAAYEAKEQTRLEEIAARNKERIKALPDDIRKDVPKGLDPESLASVLSTIEKLIPGDNGGSGVFSSGPKPRANASPTQDLDQANKLFGDLQMRRAAPGVRR